MKISMNKYKLFFNISFLFLFTSGLCAEVLDYGNNSNSESQKNILQASKIEQDKKDIFVEQYLNDNDTDSNFFNLNNKEPLANKNSDAFYDIGVSGRLAVEIGVDIDLLPFIILLDQHGKGF